MPLTTIVVITSIVQLILARNMLIKQLNIQIVYFWLLVRIQILSFSTVTENTSFYPYFKIFDHSGKICLLWLYILL
jgi:hypothetical protein